MTSKTASDTTQLADAARASAQAASRGSERTPDAPVTELAVATPSTLPVETTTSTTAPPTTTTVAPTTTTAKPKPTTTTTAKPKPTTTTTTAPKPAVVDAGPIGDDVWQKLANCEAGGRNDTGAPYYGYFQFSASTWTSLGGSGLPSDHTYDEQKALAIKLQARSGWGQWPGCAKKLGLL